MVSKLLRYVLPVTALATLVLNLPAGAQMSNVRTQNRPAQRTMMKNYQGTTGNQSNTPQSAPINSTSNLGSYSPSSAPLLRIGSRGKAVKDIQAYLKKENLYKGRIDGVYGSNTRTSVEAFQRSHKLASDGVVGQKTWSSMINSPVS